MTARTQRLPRPDAQWLRLAVPGLLCALAYAWVGRNLAAALWPHAAALRLLWGIGLSFEPGLGYVAAGGWFYIGADCSGVKLFASAWLMLCLLMESGQRSWRRWLFSIGKWGAWALAGAFFVTVMRISASIPFCAMPQGPLIHRLLSLMVYFLSLGALYLWILSHNKKVGERGNQ